MLALILNIFFTKMVQEFLPDMVDRNDGHIVNFSSLAGIGGFPLAVHYWLVNFSQGV